MITRTLAQLRSQVQRFLNEPIATTGRHTNAKANASINAAIRRYHLILCENGITLNKRATLTTSASETVTEGWAANEVVALPSDFLRLQSLSILDGSNWVPMSPFAEAERDDYEGASPVTGTPVRFRIGTNNAGTPLVRLLPASDGVYSIRCLYLPSAVELTDDADTYSFIDGTEEWVELEAALDMLGEDGVPEPRQAQMWLAKQQRAEATIKRHRRLGQGPARVVDTRARRDRADMFARWY